MVNSANKLFNYIFMIIFGWGKDSTVISTPVPNSTNQAVLTTYSYFHIFWLLRTTFARDWYLVTVNEEGYSKQDRKSKQEITELLRTNPIQFHWFIFNQSLLTTIALLLITFGVTSAITPKKEITAINNIPKPIKTIQKPY
jgi:hypothetical protein